MQAEVLAVFKSEEWECVNTMPHLLASISLLNVKVNESTIRKGQKTYELFEMRKHFLSRNMTVLIRFTKLYLNKPFWKMSFEQTRPSLVLRGNYREHQHKCFIPTIKHSVLQLFQITYLRKPAKEQMYSRK